MPTECPPNRQLVAVQGDEIIIMMPKQRMRRREALEHAAWIVALAEQGEDEFRQILEAVYAS